MKIGVDGAKWCKIKEWNWSGLMLPIPMRTSPLGSVSAERLQFVPKKKNRFFSLGEVSDSESNSSSSSSDSDSSEDEVFRDGYDDDLMGDAEDRARLEQMTEKEREQELFNRIEKREVLKRR